MLTRVLLAVLLCGMAAGLAMGAMQHFRLTPLILQAETFEHAEAGHGHGTTTPQAPAQESAGAEWAPQDGTERTLYTFLASILAGAGFAGLLTGAALVTGKTITRKSGWLWGLCGFVAVSLAPAAGLAPELPGMPAADLFARQIWWLLTIAATASALWLLAFKRESWAVALALALVVIPHIIGAPQPAEHESGVPAALASQFVGASLGANAAMWLLIGILLGYVLPKVEAARAP
jgi:cobalt transporter subunit CbtA